MAGRSRQGRPAGHIVTSSLTDIARAHSRARRALLRALHREAVPYTRDSKGRISVRAEDVPALLAVTSPEGANPPPTRRPPVGDLAWRSRGSCRDSDPALFHGPDREPPRVKRAREAAAKAVCTPCPVLATCRKWALTAREPYGVWGGLGEKDRREINTRRTNPTTRAAAA